MASYSEKEWDEWHAVHFQKALEEEQRAYTPKGKALLIYSAIGGFLLLQFCIGLCLGASATRDVGILIAEEERHPSTTVMVPFKDEASGSAPVPAALLQADARKLKH